MSKQILICPKCFSRKLTNYDHYYYKSTKHLRYQCEDCKHITIYPLIKEIATRQKKNPPEIPQIMCKIAT